MNWQRFRYTPCLPLGEDGKRLTGCREHIELSRTAATEGMVLLKNTDSLLPLKKGAKIALFGKASADYVKGGGGSGDTTVAYVRNLCEAMNIKQSENKVSVFPDTSFFYSENVKEQYKNGIRPGQTVEPELPKELLNKAKDFADIAVISICRYSTEGWDRAEKDDFYLTDAEKKMVDAVSGAFDDIVLVLNVGGMVDTSYFGGSAKIKSVLLAWQAGMEGGLAEADILCGDVTPSGKLSDTFAGTFADYPSSYNFNESKDYVEYTDDIFVGYRFFETVTGANEKVNYPFGFGLSYTDFEREVVSCQENDNSIIICVKVTNIGSYSGKDVVEIFVSAPSGKLEKPKLELKAFSKTKLLNPQESELLTVVLDINSCNSYDEETASYILEKGWYEVFAGSDVRNTQSIYEFEIPDTVVVSKVKNRCVPKKLSKRLMADGTFSELSVSEYGDEGFKFDKEFERPEWRFKHIIPDKRWTEKPNGNISIDKVLSGENTVEELVSQFSDDELITILGGRPNAGIANTFGIGDMWDYDIPNIMTADGPAGLRIAPQIGINTTAFPCATLLACSFNTEIVEKVGKAGALEVKENNVGIWLTPAVNIHRSPLCGRNFEYYSEDPYLTGKMAAAMIKGIQSVGIAACIKHFVCNNKETNRLLSDSIVSERALREIYLKAFEIAIKESEPLCLMTSYNKMNGSFTSENSELICGILREEWGFSGLVTTDWANYAEEYKELLAGNNLRMPVPHTKRMQYALKNGLVSREVLEENAKYIISLILKLA